MNRGAFKKFAFMWEYVDTSEVNGKPYLPLYLTETNPRFICVKTHRTKKRLPTD